MRLEGTNRLIRQLRQLPDKQQDEIRRVIKRATNEGARIARTLAPVESGLTVAEIEAEIFPDGMAGEVVAVDSSAPRDQKDRQYSIEHGRKKGTRGVTIGAKYMWRTRQYLAQRHRKRIKAAIRRAIKKAVT